LSESLISSGGVMLRRKSSLEFRHSRESGSVDDV
jgi:hypothetical protein